MSSELDWTLTEVKKGNMNMETSQSSKTIEPKMLDPFIGPRPFTRTRDDQKRFFGRDDETDEIVSLILGHRLTLVYAQSGAGKTSILEAQVGPKLVEYGFEVLPRARVGIASDSKVEPRRLTLVKLRRAL